MYGDQSGVDYKRSAALVPPAHSPHWIWRKTVLRLENLYVAIATWNWNRLYKSVRKRAREKCPGNEVVRKRPALRQIVWECQSQTWVWQGCSYYIFLYFLAIDWITKTSTMGRKKRNLGDLLDTNRRQSQIRAGQDYQARGSWKAD